MMRTASTDAEQTPVFLLYTGGNMPDFNRRSFAIVFTLAIFISFSASIQAHAEDGIPFGARPATSADRAAIEAAGLPYTLGMLWNPNDPNVGQASGDAKQYLQQRATKGSNIGCLNPQFAEKVKNMIEAIPQGYPAPIIDSGWRGQAAQEQARKSGASGVGWCGSYHNYGLAVDMNNTGKQTIAWLRANASQFGIGLIGNVSSGCTRSGFCDPAHFQNAGRLPPRNQCGGCGSQGGDGRLPDNTASGEPYQGAVRNYSGPSAEPPSSIAPGQSQAPPTQPDQKNEAQCTLPDGLTVPCSAIANKGAVGTPLEAPKQALPTNQQPLKDSPQTNPVSLSFGTTSTSTKNTPAAIDLINALANPTLNSSQADTNAPLVLTIGGEDAVRLQQTGESQSDVLDQSQPPAQISGPWQTFTSGDLSQSLPRPYPPEQLSSLQRTLSAMKETLLRVLEYLRPFRGHMPYQVGIE